MPILYDVLIRTKHVDDSIKIAFIRSDNTGCYHSISNILRYLKSRANQLFKFAALIILILRGKNYMTTAAEFFRATHANEGIRAVYSNEARMDKLATGPRLQPPK